MNDCVIYLEKWSEFVDDKLGRGSKQIYNYIILSIYHSINLSIYVVYKLYNYFYDINMNSNYF